MDHIAKEIGNNLKELRERYGYSLRHLGDKAGISHTYISKIEKGEKIPTIETLEKLSNIFNVKISYFFGEEQNIPEEYKEVADELGIEWITFTNDMKKEGYKPDEIREAVLFIQEFKNKFNKK